MILLCFKILMGVEKMHLIWSCENIRCIYIKIFAYLYQFSVTSNMETFKRSFLIYAGTLWNDLPDRMKNACSFKSFKQNLSSRRDTKVYYYFGKRWPSIHHARLCIGCCKLKSHLSHNLHILTNPGCACGHINEDCFHYFFACSMYENERQTLMTTVQQYVNPTLDTLLLEINLLASNKTRMFSWLSTTIYPLPDVLMNIKHLW